METHDQAVAAPPAQQDDVIDERNATLLANIRRDRAREGRSLAVKYGVRARAIARNVLSKLPLLGRVRPRASARRVRCVRSARRAMARAPGRKSEPSDLALAGGAK